VVAGFSGQSRVKKKARSEKWWPVFRANRASKKKRDPKSGGRFSDKSRVKKKRDPKKPVPVPIRDGGRFSQKFRERIRRRLRFIKVFGRLSRSPARWWIVVRERGEGAYRSGALAPSRLRVVPRTRLEEACAFPFPFRQFPAERRPAIR